MADANAANITARITADASEFKKGSGEAQSSLAKLSKQTKDTITDIAKFGVAAAAAGAAMAAYMVKNAMDSIDAQAKLAQQLGTTSSSMATLTRAGQLSGVSMEKLQSAGRALTVRLSQAAAGAGPAAASLDRLGLSAEQLADLPLDQRIATINDAIKATIPAAQQAAVAATLFGKEAGVAIGSLSPETIAQARREAELFGLAISDVDAAKIEMANDSFSTIGMAVDGLSQQMAIELAPTIKAVSDMFIDAAEEGGGMGEIVSSAFDKIVNGAVFVMNAVDGIKRVLSVVLDSFVWFTGKAAEIIDRFAIGVMETLDEIPGVDMSGPIEFMRQDLAAAEAMASTAAGRIGQALNEPLAGDKFRAFVDEAKAAGQAAAEAAVEARAAVDGQVVATGGTTDNSERERIDAKLESIRQANLTELQLNEEKFAAENEQIRLWKEQNQITVDEANSLSAAAAQQYASEKLSIEQDRADKELAIERAKEQAKRAILSDAFGGLTTLMNSESRKMFEIGKSAAISQALISTYTGMAKALELGWPLGPIAAGAIALTGFQNVASIRAQSFRGGGGGSGAPSNTAAVNANTTPTGGSGGGGGAHAPQTLVNLTIAGQGPIPREQVIGLWDQIKQLQSEGALVSLV